MKNSLTAVEDVPPKNGEGLRPAEPCRNADNDRWENEGGALTSAPNRPAELCQRAPRLSVQTEYVVLISGLLFCFGFVTLMMTIGATPEEAKIATAMTAYGALSITFGVVIAAISWFYRVFRSVAPDERIWPSQ